MSLSENIRMTRLAKRLSQKKVADHVGVSSGAVSQWESAITSPDVEKIPLIAEALGVSIGELFGTPEEFEIPLGGTVSAGDGVNEPANNGDMLQIHKLYPSGCVACRVNGNSMSDDGILPGDYVIVRRDPSPQNGERVVAWIAVNDSSVLKRLRVRGGRRWLESCNHGETRAPIPLTDRDVIFGVLVGLLRKY